MSDSFGYSTKISVTAEDKTQFVEFAKRTVRAAGAATLPFFRSDIEVLNKAGDGQFDPVTEADRAAETVIRDALAESFPTHGVYGEEYGYQTGNGLTWVIDPIDGTRAFMTGMLHWGVLLGLFDGDVPIVGAMYQPYTQELFYGDGERTFFAQGDAERQLRTSLCDELGNAVLATTGFEWFEQEDRLRFDQLRSEVQLWRTGGDCYIYGLVAMGHVHLGTDASLNPYDIQALIPIVQGAGGVVTTYDGGNASMGGAVLASANEVLHRKALDALSRR